MDKKKKLVGNSAQKSGVHSFPCSLSTSSLCFVCPYTNTRRPTGATAFCTECRVQLLSNRVGELQLVGGSPASVGCGRRNSGLLCREPTAVKDALFQAGDGSKYIYIVEIRQSMYGIYT